jgi:UPF0755 protein
VYNAIYNHQGSAQNSQTIFINQGDNALDVGEKLDGNNVISGKYFLAFYLWKSGQLHNIIAGAYEFTPGLKIPEVAKIITGGEVKTQRVKLTFPEGWTAKQMAERIKANGFSDTDFLSIVKNPSQNVIDSFPILAQIPKGQSLEGFLFPDTYYFVKDATAEDIVVKMVKNFSQRISDNMLTDIAGQKKTLFEIITMASIVETEVKTDDDRKIVAGLFWKRIADGQRLQSDATLEYVLQTNVFQHTLDDLQYDSPYNTYKYAGLPPGPVSNPGISAITAAIYPIDSPYYYFLSDPKTGKTVFSKTFEEHVANKNKFGL